MIKRELKIFLVVGVLTVLVDFCSYRLILWLLQGQISVAKALGFLAGTIFAFWANRRYTFNVQRPVHGDIPRFALVYLLSLGLNVGINTAILHALGREQLMLLAAFVLATGVSASFNFIGMKWFVFRTKPSESSA